MIVALLIIILIAMLIPRFIRAVVLLVLALFFWHLAQDTGKDDNRAKTSNIQPATTTSLVSRPELGNERRSTKGDRSYSQ